MQTTLLGLGIAIILALLTALVGPLFVNWNDYRAFFEARASELAGTPVRIAGPIEARLLPSPSLSLRDVEARDAAGRPQLKIGELAFEFALGALLRGEWRASELRLLEPELTLALDGQGRLESLWAQSASAPGALSVDRLALRKGRAVVRDAASASTHRLEDVSFSGEVRSLAGPIKGEGSFAFGGVQHGFRLSLPGAGADGTRRLRLVVGGSEEPLTADLDGTLASESGVPRFEGNVSLARAPGVAMLGGRAVAQAPWRLGGRVRASATRAVFEQFELQYGTDERALKLAGAAELTGGPRPLLQAVLSARQLDIDRFVALPEETRTSPVSVLRALAAALETASVPDIPLRLGFGVDQLTLAGATLQSFRGDIASGAKGWTLDALEFRAPGSTQVRASGRTLGSGDALSFTGPASIEAKNPRALIAWLEGQVGVGGEPMGPLSASGEVTLGPDQIAIDKLNAEVDRKTVTGRVAYASDPTTGNPRIAADLKAAELDLDALWALAQKAFPGVTLAVPGEVALALDLGLARAAGIDAKSIQANLTLDAQGLAVERFKVGDLAGTRLDARGRIEAPWDSPHGGLTVDLSGERLDGVVALLERFLPGWGAPLRSAAPQLVPAALHGVLELRPAEGQAGGGGSAKLRVNGSAGALRLDLSTDGSSPGGGWAKAELRSSGKIEASDGRVLGRLLEIDRVLASGSGPGVLRWTASGALDRDLRIEGELKAAGIDLTGKGAVRFAGDRRWSGGADLSVTAADAVPFRVLAEKLGAPAPLAFKGRFSANPDYLALENLTGSVAGRGATGRVGLSPGAPARLDGRLDFDAVPVAALVGAIVGTPVTAPLGQPGAGGPERAGAPAAGAWAPEPFASPLLGGLTGQLEIRAKRAVLTRDLAIEAAQAVFRPNDRENTLQVGGRFSGGRVNANLGLVSGPFGRTATVKLSVADAEAGKAFPGASPVSGRFSLKGEATGSGASAAALVGSLSGTGALSLAEADIEGLNPRVFGAAIRAADAGAAIDPANLASLAEKALGNGRLRVGGAEAALTIAAGQVRAGSFTARGEGADLTGSGSLDLAQGVVDARFALLGPPSEEVSAGRPEVAFTLKGPLAAPERILDVSSLVGWLTLRSVELQARRLDVLEAERRASEARQNPGAPAASAPGPAAPTPSVPVVTVPARPESRAQPIPPARPAAPSPPQRVPSSPLVGRDTGTPSAPARLPRRPAPPPVSERAPSPLFERAPPFGPPLNIRPAPEPRRSNQPRGSGESESAWDRPRYPQPDGRRDFFDDSIGAGRR